MAADDDVYGLDLASIRKLQETVQRLESQVLNLRRASPQTYLVDETPELYFGKTTTNADNPDYPASPANTFCVKLVDTYFAETVGANATSPDPGLKYVIARTLDGSYIPADTDVILERRVSRCGMRWWIRTEPQREPILFTYVNKARNSSGTDVMHVGGDVELTAANSAVGTSTVGIAFRDRLGDYGGAIVLNNYANVTDSGVPAVKFAVAGLWRVDFKVQATGDIATGGSPNGYNERSISTDTGGSPSHTHNLIDRRLQDLPASLQTRVTLKHIDASTTNVGLYEEQTFSSGIATELKMARWSGMFNAIAGDGLIVGFNTTNADRVRRIFLSYTAELIIERIGPVVSNPDDVNA